MIVVSDTSPICYLLLIDQIMILQELYELVVIPEAVADELKASESPSIVRNWIANPPLIGSGLKLLGHPQGQDWKNSIRVSKKRFY
jgi:hypothetical protein